MPRRALVWLRRDLRLNDHTALALATSEFDEVFLAFVYDRQILDSLPDRRDRRVSFIQSSLDEVHAKTGALVTLHGDPVDLIPPLADELGVDLVVAAHDDDPYAIRRDAAVKSLLGDRFQTVLDHLIRERAQIVKDDGSPYRVFTPFCRAWRASVTELDFLARDPRLDHVRPPPGLITGKVGNHTLAEIGFESPGPLVFEPGENAARRQLSQFSLKLTDYKANRNTPSWQGTSGLSVALRFGTVSIRECFRATAANPSAGATTWENELIWREFYHMILANFPEVGEGMPFNPQYKDLIWPGDPNHFELWKDGCTGYPLVDAAMRCFSATGWMHNRLRMVVAMFLTKDLLLDWRLGEQYFADNLLDYELASNNGGWQWSAGTGADAQPYFRVFNPVLQSRKFDPDGAFIKEWVPELRGVQGGLIHWPFADDGSRTLETPDGYPSPIVSHAEQRVQAMKMFQASK